MVVGLAMIQDLFGPAILVTMTDILDIVEGEEYFNPEDLDEREVLGDDDEDSSKQPLVYVTL